MSQIDAGNEGCPACSEQPELLGRYRLDRELETKGPGRAFRATRLDDTMLARVSVIELAPTLDDETVERLTAQLAELRHSKLARVVEVWHDPERRRLWTLHEPVGGRSLTEIAREGDPRLEEPRWVRSVARQLIELLAFVHTQRPPVLGLGFGLDVFVVRHGVGGAQRKGPPRLSLIELRPTRFGADKAATAREDLRQLGLSLRELFDETTDPDPSWREHPGLDAELRDMIDQMIASEDEPQLSAIQLRRELDQVEDRRRDARAPSGRRSPGAQPKPAPSRMQAGPPPLSRESIQSARPTPAQDVPVMRPADLSRELSQAYRATAAVEERDRGKQPLAARLMLVVLVAIIAALTTYIAIRS